MSPSNAAMIREIVASIGEELKDKLPSIPGHEIRNSYAHVWRSIKESFGVETYKDLSDEQVPAVLEFLEKLKIAAVNNE